MCPQLPSAPPPWILGAPPRPRTLSPEGPGPEDGGWRVGTGRVAGGAVARLPPLLLAKPLRAAMGAPPGPRPPGLSICSRARQAGTGRLGGLAAGARGDSGAGLPALPRCSASSQCAPRHPADSPTFLGVAPRVLCHDAGLGHAPSHAGPPWLSPVGRGQGSGGGGTRFLHTKAKNPSCAQTLSDVASTHSVDNLPRICLGRGLSHLVLEQQEVHQRRHALF